jgi:predicted alpha/beta-hydrolase family hydrolase
VQFVRKLSGFNKPSKANEAAFNHAVDQVANAVHQLMHALVTTALCHATVRAAVAEAGKRLPKLPLIAGGRSFGGRMTSQTQAKAPLPGVLGLAFLGFPLHPAGKPSDERAAHLSDVKIPMLFLQGTRDALAELSLLRPVAERLGKRATLTLFDEADHSFHVPAKTGRKDADVRREMLDALAAWTKALL